MSKVIRKSNERILCKLSKSESLRLYSIIHDARETTKTSNFTCQSKSSSVNFSLAKFQLMSCNLSLAIIWQMTYTQKLPKLCSATLILPSMGFSTFDRDQLANVHQYCQLKHFHLSKFAKF